MSLDLMTVHDPHGEAWRQCRDGAREMMVRELVRNAIEACERKPRGERQIRIYGSVVPGFSVPKLSFFNRGGMDLKTLMSFSEINAETDKRKGLRGNLGRGAKIASIMSNQLGMRFRSCHSGRVLEVLLRADVVAEEVGREEFVDGIGPSYIRDVTPEYQSPSHDFLNLETDWTEVTLFGNKEEQNTCFEPYEDVSLAAGYWLFNAIGMRFFNVPPDVDLRVSTKVTHLRNDKIDEFWMRFTPLCQLINAWQDKGHKYSCLEFEYGMIHYIETGNADGERISSYFARSPFGGVVWKDEIHYLHSGTSYNQIVLGSRPWASLAMKWGLVRAYSKVAILVELNDEVATNDVNRTQLRMDGGLEVDPEQFSEAVRDEMPDWVRDIEKSLEPPEDEHAKNIREHLRDLMREFRNHDDGLTLAKIGEIPAQKADEGQGGDGGEGSAKNRSGIKRDDEQPPNAQRRRRPMDAPRAQWETKQWFEDRGMGDLAVMYLRNPGEDVLFFNQDHGLFTDLVSRLAAKLPPDALPEVARDIAKGAAKNVAYAHVGTYLVGTISLTHSYLSDDRVTEAWQPVILTGVMATARVSREFDNRVPDLRRSFQSRIRSAA